MSTYKIYGCPSGYDEPEILGHIEAVDADSAKAKFFADLVIDDDEAGAEEDHPADGLPVITSIVLVTDQEMTRTAEAKASWEAQRDAMQNARNAGISPWTGRPVDLRGGDSAGYLDDD